MNKILFLAFIYLFKVEAVPLDPLKLNLAKNQTDSSLEALFESQKEESESDLFSENKKEDSKRSVSSKNIQKIKIQKDNRFKVPASSVISKKPKKRLDLDSVQPSSVPIYDSQGSDEAQLEEVMIEEEKQLYRLLKKNRNAELTLRLGALYVDRSRIIAYKIQNDYEFKMEEFNKGLRKSKPYLNLKPAQAYNRKSLKLFDDFKQSYPNHKRMDEVLFFLGFNFYQLKNKKRGIEYYSELEKKFPKSFYLYSARFQLGEHYFQLKDWKRSFRYYSLVSKKKSGKFYFYALYKMAWSLYKINRVSQGLSLLKRIIQEGKAFASVSDRSHVLNFIDEAVQDLVLFYIYSGQSSFQARSFFVDLLGETEAWPLLENLAYAYQSVGQSKDQLVLFQNLIDQNPSGKKAFEYKYQIVTAVYNTGKLTSIVRTIREWVEDYGPGSSWAVANQGDSILIQKSFQLQEVTIRDYALKNHQTYKKTKYKLPRQLALNLYEYYFLAFKKSEYSDQMYFWYAELLFDSKKYISAIKSYEEVISLFPNSKYSQAAYLNQILAFEKSFPKENEIKKMTGKSSAPVELPQIIKSFVRVANRYIKKVPKAKNNPSILYTIASMYYKFNQFEKATRYFKLISEQHSSHSLAGNVNSILLDVYNKNKNYTALEELALKLSKKPNLNRGLLKEVKSILEQISFKKAQDLSNKGKHKQSAVLYEKFAKQYPGSEFAVSSFFNAGLNFEKSKDYLKAVSMYSSVLTYKTGTAAVRKKSHKFTAVLYEKLGFYKKAAESYVSFAKNYPLDPKSSNFWYNAGIIFDALNDIPSAVYSYNKYYETSKNSDRYDSLFLIGSLYERNKNWKRAIQNYNQFLKTPASSALQVMTASFSIADIYDTKLKQSKLAKKWHQNTLNLYRKLNKGAVYGARSHFYLVKANFYNPFSKLKIPSDPKKQEKALTTKIKLLQNLERALKPVIRYNKGEAILASLVLIGKANTELAQEIETAPIPKGLNKAGQLQYKQGIKAIIEPYIKKSIDHYQLAIKRSVKLRVYSEWIGSAYSGLARIQFHKGKLVRFLPESLFQETYAVPVKDDTGTIHSNFFNRFSKSFKYGVSRSDFDNLSRAVKSKQENRVLTVVSSILNKDFNNVLAINSLAFFYLQTNRLGLAQLILNRLSSNKHKNPFILNNLAFASLKYGNPREAISFLKKALSLDSNYKLAHVNLANIFVIQKDYQNAYFYYKKAYDFMNQNNLDQNQARLLLGNYSVALTGSQQWNEGSALFQRLERVSPPRPESLFNYSCFLAERSKRESRDSAVVTLKQAKELVDELKVYGLKLRLRNKVNKLSKNVYVQMKIRRQR